MGKFISLFPAVIAATELGLSDQQRAEIVNYIVANKDKVRKRTQPGVAFEESPFKLHHLPMMAPLFDRMAVAVREALKGMGYDPGMLSMHVTRSWANYTVEGHGTTLHMHPNSHVSIVYYPDDSCNQGDICFFNHHQQSTMVPGLNTPGYAKTGIFDVTNPLSANDISYTPQPDLCLVFPSSLHHGVTKNSSSRPRLSIAVDTLFTLREYTRDEPLLPPPGDWREYPMS